MAYLGFHFGGGGGVQNIFGKVVVFAWREARGVRGHAPPREFKKNGAIWFALENILLIFCKEKM